MNRLRDKNNERLIFIKREKNYITEEKTKNERQIELSDMDINIELSRERSIT